MMGLLLGMSLFSVMSLQWARQELISQQEKNAAHDKAMAEDVAKAIEFSILAESSTGYQSDVTLDRALQYATVTTGKTRGGEDILVVARNDGFDSFGAESDQVAITASDDTLFRAQLYRSLSADELKTIEDSRKQGSARNLATLDTSAVRERQMRTSMKNMEELAAHLYSFYAGHMRFPSEMEFQEIQSGLGLTDVWGHRFNYTINSDDRALLQMTTPWNFTRSLNLSLKDGNNSND